MNKIFENAFVADEKMAYLIPCVAKELKKRIPFSLIEFMFLKMGYKIYLPVCGDIAFFEKHGLGKGEEPDTVDDYYSTRGHVYWYEKAIVLIENEYHFIENCFPFSPAVHEFGHVVNYALGKSCKKENWLSNKLPEGEPLDEYAATNHDEKFAVAFEAFCYQKNNRADFFLVNEKPKIFIERPETLDWYLKYSHNKAELYKKSPEIYQWFEQFFANWKNGNV